MHIEYKQANESFEMVHSLEKTLLSISSVSLKKIKNEKREMQVINGIINVYKIKGFTSHDVVAKLRGILKQKKIGHTGTLDPDATGVLPVCLGSATKLCDILTEKKKEYIAKVQLGVTTDTQDMTGMILQESSVCVSEEDVKSVLKEFIGLYHQIPPMYSALKVNGKKLYELAREGKEVERKARPIYIDEIEVLEINLPVFTIRVACSKGTYIRTLCHDIGQKLGCGAAMASLERTKSGQFTLETALTLEEIEKRVKEVPQQEREQVIKEFLIPVDEMFQEYAELSLQPAFERLVENGNSFEERNLKEEFQKCHREDKSQYRIYCKNHVFMGIYEYREKEKRFCPVKMFLN